MRRASFEGLVFPLVVLILWEIAARAGSAPSYLSSPSAIGLALIELARSGELFVHGFTSLVRAYAGFFVGSAIGVLLGLAAGLWRPLSHFFDPLVSFLYPVPKIAFLPVFLLLFGLGTEMQIAILSFSIFFPMFTASRSAVVTISRTVVWAAQNMGAGRARLLCRVVLPAALPQIFAGLRIALAHSFVLLFAAELIGARNGLGFLIFDSEEALRFDMMLACIMVFALLGFAHDRLLLAIQRRVLHAHNLGTVEGAAT